MKPDPQADTVRRLRCVAGHLNAIIEMAESGQPCESILHQLNAVESALHIAGSRLLACRMEESEAAILDTSSPAERAAELKRLRALYSILFSRSNSLNEVVK